MENNWNLISEKMPPRDIKILVADKNNCAVVFLDTYQDYIPVGISSGYDMYEAGLDFKPTHWMLIPELP